MSTLALSFALRLALSEGLDVFTFTKKYEIDAVRPPADGKVPRRLLIVPRLDVIAQVRIYAGVPEATQVDWSFARIREVMEWSDLLGAEEPWARVAIATPGFRAGRLVTNNTFYRAWEAWVTYMCSVQMMYWLNGAPPPCNTVFGHIDDNSLRAGAVYFTDTYFKEERNGLDTDERFDQQAWATLIESMAPGCRVLRVPMDDFTVTGLFEEGRVVRDPQCSTAPEEAVVLDRVRENGASVLKARAFKLRGIMDV
jgi:hypothetical protein